MLGRKLGFSLDWMLSGSRCKIGGLHEYNLEGEEIRTRANL